MKTLSSFLDRISNWKTLLLAIAVYMVFPAYFLKNAETKINELAGKPSPIIDLSFGFNPQKTLESVASYGDAARAYYASVEMSVDIVYPIVYTFLFGIILTLLFRSKSYKPFAYVNLLPFLTLIFDYLENFSIVNLLQSYPNSSTTVAILCEVFKLGKWLTLAAIALLTLYGLGMLALKKK